MRTSKHIEMKSHICQVLERHGIKNSGKKKNYQKSLLSMLCIDFLRIFEMQSLQILISLKIGTLKKKKKKIGVPWWPSS